MFLPYPIVEHSVMFLEYFNGPNTSTDFKNVADHSSPNSPVSRPSHGPGTVVGSETMQISDVTDAIPMFEHMKFMNVSTLRNES